MFKKVKLRPIDISFFYLGMYIDTEIYIKINQHYVLLCNNVLLTEQILRRIHNITHSIYKIYVVADYYDEIIDQSKEFSALNKKNSVSEEKYTDDNQYIDELKKKINIVDQYRELTKDTTVLIDTTRQHNYVPMEMANELTKKISRELDMIDPTIIVQCINNIRESDDYLYVHSTNVATLNGLIARWMELPEKDCNMLILIGLLHDIGKLWIPPEILNKPAKLTTEEFEIIKLHPVYSYQILIDSGITDKTILLGAKFHHERNGGTGYPDGLKGEDIPLFSRITAVSDVYDAMVSKRPYKEMHSPFDVLAEFSASRFSDLDYKVINVLLKRMPKIFYGKEVLLSDGRVGTVASLNARDLAYPIVQVGKEYIKTYKYLKCVAVDNFIATRTD